MEISAMIPIPLLEVIRKYDITNTPIVRGQKMNAAFGNATHVVDHPNMLQGTICHMDLKHREWFVGTNTSVLRTKLEGCTAFLRTDTHFAAKIVDANQVYLHEARIVNQDPLELSLDESSLIIPLCDEWRKNQTEDTWMVEQYAGGYGGWTFAHRFLSNYTFTKRRTLAVESHLPFATQYALTHAFDLVSHHDAIPHDFVQTRNRDMIFHCQIQSRTWQQQLQFLCPEIWTVSAPCKSWSKAGRFQGFHTKDGLSLAESLAQARIFRPRVLLVEQVSGFREHEHFGIFQKIVKWAGYTPAIQTVLDLADLTPVRRNRWLGLFLRMDDPNAFDLFLPQPWPTFPAQVNDFDATIELQAHELRQFQPTKEQASMYFDSKYMPGSKRTHTKTDILHFRIPPADRKIPTFMAAYGEQHLIQPLLLEVNGLFGHFRRQATTFRFWTPMEQIMLHATAHPTLLLKPQSIAWQTVGNSIAPLHALFLEFHAYQILGDFHDKISFEQVCTSYLDNRLRASTTVVTQDECAWYMGRNNEAELLQKRLQFFMAQMSWKIGESNTWPDNMYFSHDEGLLVFTRESCTQPDSATQVSDVAIAPTVPIHVKFALMPFLVPGEYGKIMVDADATWRSLLSLWEFKLKPTGFVFTWDQIDMKLIDTMPTCSAFLCPVEHPLRVLDEIPEQTNEVSRMPILLRESTDLTLYEVETKTTWRQFRQEKHLPDIHYYLQHGVVTDTTWLSTPAEITSEPPELFRHADLIEDVYWLDQIQIENVIPPTTDILAMHCMGPQEAYEPFQRLWLSKDTHDWLQTEGRQANLQRTSDTEWRVLFRPLLPQSALPVTMLRHKLFFRILQKCLASLHSVDAVGLEVIFKYKTQPVYRGVFPALMSLAPVWTVIKHAFAVLEPNRQPTVLSSGKLATDACLFQDLADRKLRPGTIVAIISDPILGGGVTSKQEFQQMIEAGIAQMFLEHGMQLPQIPPATTKLIDAVGMQRVHHILHGEGAPRKHDSFKMACKAAQIQLPEGPLPAVTKAKYQKIHDKKHKKQSIQVDPEKYQLKDGFFLNQDGSPAVILQQYSPQASGVILMGAQQAHDWLVATTALSPDELAIYVVGPLAIPDKFRSTATHAPAVGTDGQEVLLNGKLIQLGSKPICTIAANQEPIELKDVVVASVTVWKSDWDDQMWQGIISAPVRTIKNLLTLEGHQGLFGKPWGRMYQDKGNNVEPSLATSFQVHGEFEDNARFKALLKRSGFCKIFITPKDSNGKPHPDWRVIWIDATPVQLEVKASGITGVAGLIKGKKSYGLRIEATAFDAAWTALKPGQPKPDLRITAMTFRIQPLPQGITSQSLQEWGEKTGWDIKPIKAVGAKQWVVGSDHHPPSILQFNGQPLLVKQLYQKALNDNSAIAAGPRTIQNIPKTPSNFEPPNAFRMGDPHMDPWKTKPDAMDKKTEPRQPTGPVTNLLQQQEARIHAVESALTKIQQQQHTQQTQSEARFLQIESTVQNHANATKQSFDTLRTEQVQMHQSLATAMANQDEKMASNFDELKRLFLCAAKKRSAAEAENMDD